MKTRILIYSLGLVCMLHLQSCKFQDKASADLLEAINAPIPQTSNMEQVSYVLHLGFDTEILYDLFVDDVLVERKAYSKRHTVELNPYLLANGVHRLRIRFYPRFDSEDGLLHPETMFKRKEDTKILLSFIELRSDLQESIGEVDGVHYPHSNFEIVIPTEPVAFVEHEWQIGVENLPYKLLGWSDAEDLSQWDPEVLETAVVAYYNMMREMLDAGRVDAFMQLTNRQDVEISTALYETTEEYKVRFKKKKEDLMRYCPENMLPIEKYEMRLYGQGKIVALEFNSYNYHDYRGVLVSREDGIGRISWGMMLYKPKDSDAFVPIRQVKP